MMKEDRKLMIYYVVLKMIIMIYHKIPLGLYLGGRGLYMGGAYVQEEKYFNL